MKNRRDSLPVNRYSRSLFFSLPSANHFLTSFANRVAFTLKRKQLWYLLTSGYSRHYTIIMHILSTDKFHCCQALFFKCRGSALALSINSPTSGGNSCLDFFWAINEVTFSRSALGFNFEADSCSFFFVTASATLIRLLYFQGFHLLSGVRPRNLGHY